jgi:hypothetical protein
LLIEPRKKEQNSEKWYWPKERMNTVSTDWMQFKVGDQVDARDIQGDW